MGKVIFQHYLIMNYSSIFLLRNCMRYLKNFRETLEKRYRVCRRSFQFEDKYLIRENGYLKYAVATLRGYVN